MIKTEHIHFVIDGYEFAIKPEHITYVYSAWMRERERAGMAKVYGNYECFLLPNDLHAKVASKLIELKPIGDAVYKEMFDAVGDKVIMKSPEENDGVAEC